MGSVKPFPVFTPVCAQEPSKALAAEELLTRLCDVTPAGSVQWAVDGSSHNKVSLP